MKTWKKIRIIGGLCLIFAAAIFISCSKSGGIDDDESGNGFYIKFKVDGVSKIYSNKAAVVNRSYVKSRNKHVSLNISASDKAWDFSEHFIIDIDAAIEDNDGNWVGIDLVKGTYVNQGGLFELGYNLDPKFLENGGWSFKTTDKPFTITYTHLDKNTARGTFSGYIGEEGAYRHITEGEFYLRVIYTEVPY